MKRRNLLLGGLMSASLGPLLSACGGSEDGDNPQIRLVNASMGYSSLDLWVDGSKTVTDVAYGSSSSYASTDNSITTALTVTGSTSYLQSTSRSVSDKTSYALIAYGWAGAIKTALITEEEDAADDSNNVKLLVINTATDAGALDVYVTGSDESLDDSSPVVSSLAGGSQSSYVELVGNSYRVRITGASDTSSLRLDISSVTLTKGKVYILVITPGTGGVLVHAILTEQGSESATSYKNGYARVRAVASVSGGSSVTTSVSAGGVSLVSNAASPTVGSYVLVPAGTPTLAVTVAGSSVSTATTLSAEAGADVTVLVYGPSSTPVVTTLTDNNRLPSSSTGVKIRLVHAATALASSTCDLTVDYSAMASSVGYGTSSSYATLTATDTADIAATTAADGTVYSTADVTLTAQGVYTVFIASGSSGTTGILRKER